MGVQVGSTGGVVVTGNTLSSIFGEGVYVIAPTPTIKDNTAVNVGTDTSGGGAAFWLPAYVVDASALDPALLGGNSASGGWPLFSLNGTVETSGTLPAEQAAWFLEEGLNLGISSGLDVPAGITLTVAPGAVIKSQSEFGGFGDPAPNLTVEGTLHAVGTSTKPIVFTSANDSFRGTTGSGPPAAGDWNGIELGAGQTSTEFSYDVFEYASAAVQVSLLDLLPITHSVFTQRCCNHRPKYDGQ